MEWQPIETHRGDSEEVLVWCKGVYTAVFELGDGYHQRGWYGSANGRPYFEDDGSDGEYAPSRLMLEPTHWQPLPKPPI